MDLIIHNASMNLANNFRRPAKWVVILNEFWDEEAIICDYCHNKARANERTQYCPDCGCYMKNGIKEEGRHWNG